MSAAEALDFSRLFGLATRWAEFLRPEMNSYDLWRGIFDRVMLPEWAVAEFRRSPVHRLLVLGHLAQEGEVFGNFRHGN